MDRLITCRVCESPAPAQPDGVLLCPVCRAQAAALRPTIPELRDRAIAAYADAVIALTPGDLARYRHLIRAQIDAQRAGGAALATFQRRLAATRHTGDALAGVVVLSAESTRVTRWAMYALAELDALMDVEELAV